MSAGIYNDTIDQGATYTLVVVYKDENDTPINLAGYTAFMQLREDFNSATADLTLSTANGGITITAAQGKLTIVATATQTGALTADAYLYDIELVNGPVVIRLLQGQMTVNSEVTRVP
jgi:hypothetical protein